MLLTSPDARSSYRSVVQLSCVIPLTQARLRELYDLVALLTDPEQLVDECLRAGVLPTVYGSLGRVLDAESPFMQQLRSQLLQHSGAALALAAEAERLTRLLSLKGVRALLYKGLAIGRQAYGSMAGRPPGDLDFLVLPKDAESALNVLKAEGYRPVLPAALALGQEMALIRFAEGRQFVHQTSLSNVDLHWVLLDRWVGLDMSFDKLWENRAELSVGAGSIVTLGANDAALVACLHGAQHGFARLKWTLDVARYMIHDEVDWNTVRQTAAHRAPMVDYARAIARRMHLLDETTSGGADSELEQLAEKTSLALRSGLRLEAKGIVDPLVWLHLSPTLASRSWRVRLGQWGAFTRPTVSDIRRVALPSRLHLLYYFVRLHHLAVKFWRRVLRRKREEEAKSGR